MSKPEAELRKSGLPQGLPRTAFETWISALSDILNTRDARHAAERYQFLCGFLQALIDTSMVSEDGFVIMRAQLKNAWVKAVNRVDQNEDSPTPTLPAQNTFLK